MAKFYLLNQVRVGSSFIKPGTLVDDSVDNAAQIRASGGVLVPASDAAAAAQAAIAQFLVKQGAPHEDVSSMMNAAVVGELQTNAVSAQSVLPLSLNDFRIVDANNNVGNGAANGGLLASDTAPVLAATSKMPTVTWATGSVPNLGCQKAVPLDLDPTANGSLDLFVLSGTTDPATFTVQVVWDGTAAVSYTADDTATKSATLHKVSATLLATDMPGNAGGAGPSNVSVILTPAAHATNSIVLAGARLTYKRKILAS